MQRSKRKLKAPICSTLEEAIALRDAIDEELDQGELVAVEGLTVKQWGPTWLRDFRGANRNFATDCSRFLAHIEPAEFALKPMTLVEARDLIDWLGSLKKKLTGHKYGKRPKKLLSHQSRKHCLNLVRCLFADALTLGLVKANPALGLKIKKTDADRSHDQIPEEWPLKPAEQARIHDALGGDPERWIIQFAIGSGLRQGEMWNLPLGEVHVGADPHVNVRFGSNGKTPKNGKTRKVPLFGVGLEAARAWVEVLPDYAPHNPMGLMFPLPRRVSVDGKRGSRGGSRRQKSKVPACWPRAKLALGRPVWWHLLRHTAATSLICGWWGRRWSLEEVGKLLGHSSTRTTEIYAHLLDSTLAEVAAETETAWSRDRAGKLPRNCHSPSKTSENSGIEQAYEAGGRKFESSWAR